MRAGSLASTVSSSTTSVMRSNQYSSGLDVAQPAQQQVFGQREREVVPQRVAHAGLQRAVRRLALARGDRVARLERDLEQQHRGSELRFAVLRRDGLRKIGLVLQPALPPVDDLRAEHHELGCRVLVPAQLAQQVRRYAACSAARTSGYSDSNSAWAIGAMVPLMPKRPSPRRARAPLHCGWSRP